MRTRTRILTPLAASVLLLGLAACGESGSSGTGGDATETAEADASASGGSEDCAPVAGEQLVVLEDDQALQQADNIIPAVNADAADDAVLANLNAVSAALTTDQLVEMNAAVDVQRESAEDVAATWVEDHVDAAGLEQGSGEIVVGAANFTESTILATIYADVLNAAGFDASVQEAGARELYLPALQEGDIQVFPEYLGTVTNFIAEDEVATGDVQETLDTLQPLAEEAGLVFGEPSEAADQNAFAVTQEFADALGVATLSELAEVCGSGLILGGPPECPTRPFCQPGLEETYGLSFDEFRELDAGGPLTQAALRQGEISLGLVFSSAGFLAQG